MDESLMLPAQANEYIEGNSTGNVTLPEFSNVYDSRGGIDKFGIISETYKLQCIPIILVSDVDHHGEPLSAIHFPKGIDRSFTIHDDAKPRKSGAERKFVVRKRRVEYI